MKVSYRLANIIMTIFLVLSIIGIAYGWDNVTATDVATPAPSDTSPPPTDTPTSTPTDTPTSTPTDTPTDTPTSTPTDTPTSTPTDTPTSTPTSTPTNTPTSTPTSTPTNTPTSTPTSTPTNTPTSTPTSTPTNTPTSTPTSTPTNTPTSTPTNTPVPTNTTPVPTNSTPTSTPTNTPTTTPVHSQNNGGGSDRGSSRNSGSSGGFSIVSKDANGNIFKYETREEDLVVNESVEYSFATTELSIYKVFVNGKNNQDQVPVRVDDLVNTSRYANISAPGIVYKNENVWVGSKRLNYIGVRFKVNNSWIKENDLNESRYPSLLLWNGKTWLVLKTNVTGKDGLYTYFDSPKAGAGQLNVYAISAPPKKIGNKSKAVAWPTPTTVEGNQEEIIYPDIEQIEEILPRKIPGFNDIVLIIGMILALIYVIKKR